jgi:capsular polysaccharide transport system permease protein
MGIDDSSQDIRGSTALERARNLSQALADAARRARISTRSRRNFTGGGFHARQGAAVMRFIIFGSFWIMVILPSVVAIAYYGLIASDQYISEAKFTVSGGEIPKLDSIAALTGIPARSAIQDTQIVTNYIESRAAVEKLDSLINIRRLYSTSDADWFSRFDSTKPIEKLITYWKKMVDVSIKMPSGIVELKVRAFTPQDSAHIAQAILTISEQLINDLNIRMNRDAVANAEQQVDRASARLLQARVSLEKARNDEGLLDVNKTADALNGLITEMRGTLLQLRQEYDSQRNSVLESAPQMRALKSRIEATTSQIRELEAKLTSTATNLTAAPTLAVSMTKFSELDLERQIAERLYSGAIASLELSRATAERKAMYVNAFVRPVVPEQSEYPRRLLFSCLILILCLTIWGICCGFVVLVRNHMA